MRRGGGDEATDRRTKLQLEERSYGYKNDIRVIRTELLLEECSLSLRC